MNFKTTLLLVIVLAGAGIALFATRGTAPPKPDDPSAATDTNPANRTDGPPVLDVKMADVDKVTVTPADGVAFTVERAGNAWQLTRPVVAPADSVEVDTLLRDVTDAKSRGTIAADTDPKATGLNAPRYKVEVTTAAGKMTTLDVGERAVVGGNLYVRVAGKDKADLVTAELADQLDKGADPYRSKQLVTTPAEQIRRIVIARPNQPKVELEKSGTAWRITAPTPMPADDAAATDLTYAVAGLQATSFVDPKLAPAGAVARPQVTVEFSTEVPTTQPAAAPATVPTAPASVTTVVLGSYDDVLKKNVYATVKGSNAIAKVPASVLESLRKSPLDLRDKTVVAVDAAQVAKVSIQTEVPATTKPAAGSAAPHTLVLTRRPPTPAVMGPTMLTMPAAPMSPTTQPGSMPVLPRSTTGPAASMPVLPRSTTGPAASMPVLPLTTRPITTTKPATMPTTPPVPLSQWMLASDGSAEADDAKVTALLGQFNPLKADKFLEKFPTTAPYKRRFVVMFTTKAGVPTVVTITDPGNDAPLVAAYNGLTFNLPASLATDLAGDFKKPAVPVPVTPPTLPPGLTIPGAP